jgi:integrase
MVQLLHTTVHKTLKQATADELNSRNVAAAVKAQQSAKEIETLGPAQARTFLKTERGYRLEALYGMAVTTSMGQGELLRLRWEDKDLDVGAVQVRRTRWRMLTSSGLQYGCNKSEPGQHRGFCSYPTRILNSACKQ